LAARVAPFHRAQDRTTAHRGLRAARSWNVDVIVDVDVDVIVDGDGDGDVNMAEQA
jgi:hypothetical protein